MSSDEKKAGNNGKTEKGAGIPSGLTDLARAAQVLAAYLEEHGSTKPFRIDEASLHTGLTKHHIEVLIAASALGVLETSRNGSQISTSLND